MTDIGRAGMVMKGNYNSASTYETLDAVSYQNGLYVAKQNVPAGTVPTNTTYWQCALTDNIRVVPFTVTTGNFGEEQIAVSGILLAVHCQNNVVGSVYGTNRVYFYDMTTNTRIANDIVEGIAIVYNT